MLMKTQNNNNSHTLFYIRRYFIRILRLRFVKFQAHFKNKSEDEIEKNIIVKYNTILFLTKPYEVLRFS